MFLEGVLQRVSLVADVAHKLALVGWFDTRAAVRTDLLSGHFAMRTRSVLLKALHGLVLLTTSFARNLMLVTVHVMSELHVVD